MTVGKPRDDAESDQEPPGVESTSGGEGTTFEPEEDPEGADPDVG